MDESNGQSRLFILLAVAMLGLICVGLLGLGGVFFVIRSNQAQEVAVAPTEPVLIPTFTPTPTITPIPPTPTNTPEPTATATWVVNPNAEADGAAVAAPPVAEVPPEAPPAEPGATATSTLVVPIIQETAAPGVAAPPAEIPQGGGVLETTGREFLVWVGVGLLLLLILGLLNQLKSSI